MILYMVLQIILALLGIMSYNTAAIAAGTTALVLLVVCAPAYSTDRYTLCVCMYCCTTDTQVSVKSDGRGEKTGDFSALDRYRM